MSGTSGVLWMLGSPVEYLEFFGITVSMDFLIGLFRIGLAITMACYLVSLVGFHIDELRREAYHRRLKKLQKRFGPYGSRPRQW